MNGKVGVSMELSKYDIEARKLLSQLDWTPNNQAIANVFVGHPVSAFTVEQLTRLVEVLHCYREGTLDLRKDLTAAVKAGVLRSRVVNRGGERVRYYELNFA